MKPGFGLGQFSHPKNTYDPSSTSTAGPASSHNQSLPSLFQKKVTGTQIPTNNITIDKPLLSECVLSRLLPLLLNLNLHDDTLIGIKNLYYDINISLTDSIKKSSNPVLPIFHNVDPTTPLFDYQFSPEKSPIWPQYYHTYIMMYRSLATDILNSINSYALPFSYKSLQHDITDKYGCTMLQHLLVHHAPNLNGKLGDLQNQIYDLNFVPGKYLASFINRVTLLQQIILLS